MIDAEAITRNKRFYDENEDFNRFVTQHAKKHEISIEEALTHKQITITREYYEGKQNDIQQTKM